MATDPPALTADELQALRLLRKDHHLKELPALMHRSRSAVARIVQSARVKLGKSTTHGAIGAARDLGLLCLMVGAG